MHVEAGWEDAVEAILRTLRETATLSEEEAFAHQDDLSSGRTLLARLCQRGGSQPGRLGP